MLYIAENISLLPYNTFGFDVTAEYFIKTKSERQIFEALVWAKRNNKKVFPVGVGSNLVFTENIPDLVLVQGNESIVIISEHDDHAIVHVSAGSCWHSVVRFCIKNSLFGIENLSLIPGTAGAAPIQNIGAYGVELSDVIESVHAIDIAIEESIELSNSDCRFGYRESIFKHEFKGQFIITGICLKLSKSAEYCLEYGDLRTAFGDVDPSNITLSQVSNKICEIRNSKLPDPKILGNVGSFFKNPVISKEHLDELKERFVTVPGHSLRDNMYKIPAAWLVEIAGWKGHLRGSIGVHKKQSIVLVNYGDGNGKQIVQLATDIRQDVLEKFNINLEIEPTVCIDNCS